MSCCASGHVGGLALSLCVMPHCTHLLQLLVLLHVPLGGVVGSLSLLLEGLVGGHECGLLGQQRGQAPQNPKQQQGEQISLTKKTITKKTTQAALSTPPNNYRQNLLNLQMATWVETDYGSTNSNK